MKVCLDQIIGPVIFLCLNFLFIYLNESNCIADLFKSLDLNPENFTDIINEIKDKSLFISILISIVPLGLQRIYYGYKYDKSKLLFKNTST